MANIIDDEKRLPKIGEVCAIRICDIGTFEFQNNNHGKVISLTDNDMRDNSLLFIKYIGSGLFVDTVSEEVIKCIGEKIFLDENIDSESFNESEKICEFTKELCIINNIEDIDYRIDVLDKSILGIDLDKYDLYKIDSELTNEFSTQSVVDLKRKIQLLKVKGLEKLRDSYENIKNEVVSIDDNGYISKH